MKKLNKKLFLSILTVALTFIALGTSTFAWFSMNQTVTTSGMLVKTQVTSNLLISADTTEANFAPALSQAKNALVEPVSTVDGKNFFYTATSNVISGGDAKNDVYVNYATTGLQVVSPATKNNFNLNYGTENAVGYVDYTMYIKATSTTDNSKVALTKCNFLYNNTPITENAWRVAVFANATQNDDDDAADVSTELGTAVSILAPTSAENFTTITVENIKTNKAVKTTSTLDTVTYGTAAVIDSDIDAGTSRYYYVVIRLWLEGEDNTCNVETFATLTNEYSLDLEFQIGTGVTGVTAIGTTPSALTYSTVTATAAGVTLTDGKLSNGATPSTYVWHKVSDDSVVDGVTSNVAPATAGEYYCIITAADGNIYRSQTVTVA